MQFSHHWVSPILKIQIPANMIHHDEILMKHCIQMGNGFVKPHSVKMPFLRIRYEPFHILQGAGDFCLAVPFQHRNIDQEFHVQSAFAHFQLHSLTVREHGAVFLGIHQGDAVSL